MKITVSSLEAYIATLPVAYQIIALETIQEEYRNNYTLDIFSDKYIKPAMRKLAEEVLKLR